MGEAEYRRLALGISMNGCRLDLRCVLEQSFDDVDSFPDAARDEAAEQGYVGVRHTVVGSSTVRPITYRILSQEAVLGQVVFSAIGRSRTAAAPDLGEIAPVVRIDEVFDDRVELINTHVAPIGERQLVSGGQTLEVARCLSWTKIAAEREGGQDVALNRLSQLWLRARQRAEMTGPLCPEVNERQNIEEASLGHAVEQRRSESMCRR